MNFRITAEEQALLKLACMGRYLANGATNQRHAAQASTYGGFYDSFNSILLEIVERNTDMEAFAHHDLVQNLCNWDVDISDSDGIVKQLRDFLEFHGHYLIIL